MFSGFYLNELLLKLLARQDPHPGCSTPMPTRWRHWPHAGRAEEPAVLRAFELLLLRELGLLPDLATATLTASAVQADTRYTLHAEAGVVADAEGLPGRTWVALEAALAHAAGSDHAAALRHTCAATAPALRGPLRELLHYHLGHPNCARARCGLACSAGRNRAPDCMNPLVAPEAGHADPRHAGRTALSVNVNKVALLRNTRHLGIPSVVRAATLCLQAGADGITVHPRPDERHIRAHDVHDLAALLRQWPQAEYNIEGNPFHNLMDFIRACGRTRPPSCPTVKASSPATTAGTWPQDAARLRPLIAECRDLGVRVSLFMDPLPEAMALARAVGASRVELYTEPYAAAHGKAGQASQLAALHRCRRLRKRRAWA
jgi:pyridoxine 5-phosphate synthase